MKPILRKRSANNGASRKVDIQPAISFHGYKDITMDANTISPIWKIFGDDVNNEQR